MNIFTPTQPMKLQQFDIRSEKQSIRSQKKDLTLFFEDEEKRLH